MACLGVVRADCGTLSCLPIPGLACLHISTLKGNIPMMSLLLESGANIDVRVRLGMVRCLGKAGHGAWLPWAIPPASGQALL